MQYSKALCFRIELMCGFVWDRKFSTNISVVTLTCFSIYSSRYTSPVSTDTAHFNSIHTSRQQVVKAICSIKERKPQFKPLSEWIFRTDNWSESAPVIRRTLTGLQDKGWVSDGQDEWVTDPPAGPPAHTERRRCPLHWQQGDRTGSYKNTQGN